MNPRRALFPAILLALAVLLPSAARAQEEGYAFQLSNFSLEFTGGLSRIDPIDLNYAASYEEAYLQFYWVKYYDYLHALYGDGFQFTSRRTGDSVFGALDKAIPFGVRLRYQASPTLALTLGVEFLDGTRISDVGMTFDIQDNRRGSLEFPNTYTQQYQSTGFMVQAKAWVPELGAHFGWDLSRLFRTEIFIAFGPIFAQCRTLSQRHSILTTPDGFRSDSVVTTDMKGTAFGLCGEVGAGLFLRPASFFKLFVEGGYSFRQLGETSGPTSYRTQYTDSNGSQDAETSSWDNIWRVRTNNITQAWGRFTPLSLQNQNALEAGLRRFNPDLSGWQLKAGLAVVF